MAWEEHLFDLFDDLEQQAQALHAADRAPEVADRSRAEYRSVTLASRLMASEGHDVGLWVVGVGTVRGRLDRVAAQWCLVSGAGQDWVVPLDAVGAVRGASSRGVPEVAWPRTATLGLGSALRRLADAGHRCVCHRRDGGRHEGVLGRVGADFVEVEGQPVEGPAGDGAVAALVAFAGLAAVQSRD